MRYREALDKVKELQKEFKNCKITLQQDKRNSDYWLVKAEVYSTAFELEKLLLEDKRADNK